MSVPHAFVSMTDREDGESSSRSRAGDAARGQPGPLASRDAVAWEASGKRASGGQIVPALSKMAVGRHEEERGDHIERAAYSTTGHLEGAAHPSAAKNSLEDNSSRHGEQGEAARPGHHRRAAEGSAGQVGVSLAAERALVPGNTSHAHADVRNASTVSDEVGGKEFGASRNQTNGSSTNVHLPSVLSDRGGPAGSNDEEDLSTLDDGADDGDVVFAQDQLQPGLAQELPEWMVDEEREQAERERETRARSSFTTMVRTWSIHLGVLLAGMGVIVLIVLSNAEVIAASTAYRLQQRLRGMFSSSSRFAR